MTRHLIDVVEVAIRPEEMPACPKCGNQVEGGEPVAVGKVLTSGDNTAVFALMHGVCASDAA